MTFSRKTNSTGPLVPNRFRHLRRMWESYLSETTPPQLDRWMAAKLAEHRGFGKKDRRFYSDAIFAAVRHGLFSHAAASESGYDGKTCGRMIERMSLIKDWNSFRVALSSADTDLFFDHVFARAGMGANESVRTKCRRIRDELESRNDLESLMLLHSIPVSLSELIARRGALWGKDDLLRFFGMLDTRSPLWVRVNDVHGAQAVIASLEGEGFGVGKTEGGAFAMEGESALYHSAAYKDGKIEIQDYASQMIGVACDIAPGMYVWDACAGGGGKTMQIASFLQGKGAVYASDIRAYKLEETKRRARKAGFSNVRIIPWDGNILPEFPKEVTSRSGFHKVLVDAPCSASGTWRRNPDAKYRISPRAVEELSSLQLSILNRASEAVRENGKLIYATCSFFPAENEDIVNGFLAAHSGFALEKMNLHGSPSGDADTTFTAVFSRKKS